MDVAWRLLEAGIPAGAGALAETQTKGRGRFGRRWVSVPGDSLLLSVVLRPPATVAPLLSIIAGLAVTAAVHDIAGVQCAIKWPNDVCVRGRKLCGILVEGRVSTAGDAVAVLGIGLNLNLDTRNFPELLGMATSLRAETGRGFQNVEAAAAVLARLDEYYGRASVGEDVVSEWRTVLETLGKRITVRQTERVLTGLAEDVDELGRLLLRMDGGVLEVLAEGETTART